MNPFIHRSGSLTKGFDSFDGDAISVQSDGFVEVSECDILDNHPNNNPHRDAIQLIPNNGRLRGQYAAAEMRNILIQNNFIRSSGLLQGIFSSDGMHRNLVIKNNIIITNSQHHVSINGLMSGWIEGNNLSYADNRDAEPAITLWPLRIGGGAFGRNVYILSFVDDGYDNINHIVHKSQENIIDNREVVFNNRDVFLSDFRLNEFKFNAGFAQQNKDAQIYGRDLQNLAMDFGSIIN